MKTLRTASLGSNLLVLFKKRVYKISIIPSKNYRSNKNGYLNLIISDVNFKCLFILALLEYCSFLISSLVIFLVFFTMSADEFCDCT